MNTKTLLMPVLFTCLPEMRLLTHLHLEDNDYNQDLSEQDNLVIGCYLKAWPPPFHVHCRISLSWQFYLSEHWQVLGLPEEAQAEEWDLETILEHFRMQQDKMVAYASGLHARLGEVPTL